MIKATKSLDFEINSQQLVKASTFSNIQHPKLKI